MKVRLEGTGASSVLRCPLDGKQLMVVLMDDINLQDCEHYRWHVGPDEDEIVENEKNENEEESEEEDWDEVLKHNYIAKVSVEDGAFYLLHLEKVHLEKEVKEG